MKKAIREKVCHRSTKLHTDYFKKAEVLDPEYIPFLERDAESRRNFVPKQKRSEKYYERMS